MTIYYDDNFGEWERMDEPGMEDWYREVQEKSVLKRCSICGGMFYLLPKYDKCDACMRHYEICGDWPCY